MSYRYSFLDKYVVKKICDLLGKRGNVKDLKICNWEFIRFLLSKEGCEIAVYVIPINLFNESFFEIWENGKSKEGEYIFCNLISPVRVLLDKITRFLNNVKSKKNYIVLFPVLGYESQLSKFFRFLISNPDFLDFRQAFFKMEFIHTNQKDSIEKEFIKYIEKGNFDEPFGNLYPISLSTNSGEIKTKVEKFVEFLKEEINKIPHNHIQKLSKRKQCYKKVFIEPYIEIYNGMHSEDSKDNVNTNNISVNEAFKVYYNFYKKHINKRNAGSHEKSLDLFRLPVPFFLQDLESLLDYFKDEIEKRENRKIKLLLIDNKPREKIVCINKFLKKFSLRNCFEMICIFTNTDNDEKEDIALKTVENNQDIKLAKASFTLSTIKKIAEKLIEAKKNREYNFILLDFFLDSQDSIQADYFIKILEDKKLEKKDFSKDWVFMISKYSDSFVKYLNSGTFSTVYPTVYIDFGAEPNRGIIFVYKLLKFIKNRLDNFKKLHENIVDTFLKKNEESSTSDKEEERKDFLKYLPILDELIKETSAIGDIFFKEPEKAEKIYLTLKNLIEMYVTISPADVGRLIAQVNLLNLLVENAKMEKMFADAKGFYNRKINKDLEKWSQG